MVAEPASLEFLVNNGFSIDRLVKEGAPYIVNHEPSAQGRDINTSKLLREVLESIIRSRKPIIVHNGLLDLMFLYQKFYNDLPQEMEIFLSDLSEMFPGGIYDTKTIAEYMSAEKASYLKYLFKKYEREQSRLKADSQPCVSCEDLSAPLDLRSPHPPPLPKHPGKKHSGRMGYPNTGKPYCEQYALHGHCPARHSSCHKSHDLDFILDYDEGIISEVPSSKRFKGQAEQRRADPPAPSQHTSHSACYDAFMTGYVFSVQKLLAGYEHYINKMYLMNKQIPLVVKKSIYSTTSNAHRKSLTRILNLKPQKDKKINTVDS